MGGRVRRGTRGLPGWLSVRRNSNRDRSQRTYGISMGGISIGALCMESHSHHPEVCRSVFVMVALGPVIILIIEMIKARFHAIENDADNVLLPEQFNALLDGLAGEFARLSPQAGWHRHAVASDMESVSGITGAESIRIQSKHGASCSMTRPNAGVCNNSVGFLRGSPAARRYHPRGSMRRMAERGGVDSSTRHSVNPAQGLSLRLSERDELQKVGLYHQNAAFPSFPQGKWRDS